MPVPGATTTTATMTDQFLTLEETTAMYRLHDPNISNSGLAIRLGISNGYRDYPCCFFRGGNLVAVRTKHGVAIFLSYKDIQNRMVTAGIGVRIS